MAKANLVEKHENGAKTNYTFTMTKNKANHQANTVKYRDELKKECVEVISNIPKSEKPQYPLMIISLINSLNLRSIDISESIVLLYDSNHVIPSTILLRSLFENVAVINRAYSMIEKTIQENSFSSEELLHKMMFGARYSEKIKAINIMTQLKHLDKKYNRVLEFYESLCEFTHPNWDGVAGSYSNLKQKEAKMLFEKQLTNEHPLNSWFFSCHELCLNIQLDTTRKVKKSIPKLIQVLN